MNKTYVCRDYEASNKYTTPIMRKPSYRNSGIIKAVTGDGKKIQVGRITFELFENEEFQYIISPFWQIIDMLSTDVFQGIPGIDMGLRLEHYYRVNYEPVFITGRTPEAHSVDLLEASFDKKPGVYDRLEWLICTDMRPAGDNLIVERHRDCQKTGCISDRKELSKIVEKGQYGDEIIIEDIHVLGRNCGECISMLNRIMHSGITLSCLQKGICLSVEDYKGFLPIFSAMYEMEQKKRKQLQRAGIELAKEKGVYHGRKRLSTDEALFENVVMRFHKKEISLEEALSLTGFSKSTFYRRIKEL